MNATRMMLCAIAATAAISATAFGATARTVDGFDATGTSVAEMQSARQQLVVSQTAIDGRSSVTTQIALNPQPLPPGRAG